MAELASYIFDDNGVMRKVGSLNRFNRVLYGGHENDTEGFGKFFTFAGDAPIFMGAASDCMVNNWCYQAKRGVLQSGLALTPGVTFGGAVDSYGRWFHNSRDVISSWHHGYMEYKSSHISDYFPESEVNLEVYPLQKHDGYLVHYQVVADSETVFCAVLAGMTGYIGRFDPPESPVRDLALEHCLQGVACQEDDYGILKDSQSNDSIIAGCSFDAELSVDGAAAAMEKTPTLALVDHEGAPAVLKFTRRLAAGEVLEGDLVVLYNSTPEVLKEYLAGDQRAAIKAAIAEKYSGIKISTPDQRLDSTVLDQQIALDAAYHTPTFFHGAIGYHAPFLGWRGWYGGTLAGWFERIRCATRAHLATQMKAADEPEKVWYDGADRPDLDHEGTQYHHLMNSYGRLSAMLYKDDIYDMQEVFTDMVFHYLERSGDLELGKEIFEAMAEALAWEERIFDPDNDGLYQSFLNTWISDGHCYNGGGCAQASCYNYAANTAMVRLGRKLNYDVTLFEQRAEKIKNAVNAILWQEDKGVFAEYIDTIGNKLLHPAPELSTIYLASESGIASAEQMARSLEYTEKSIRSTLTFNRKGRLAYSSNWLPKKYSTFGLFPAENAALALAYFKYFRKEAALQILDGLLDVFASSPSPGAISHVSTANGNCDSGDWDFTDVSSPYLRLLVEGLWGVNFRLLSDEIFIAPQLPDKWNNAALELPDIKIDYKNNSGRITLQINCSRAGIKHIILPGNITDLKFSDKSACVKKSDCAGVELTEIAWQNSGSITVEYTGAVYSARPELLTGIPRRKAVPPVPEQFENIDCRKYFNVELAKLFDQKYLAPRPEGYSIGMRINGRYAWEWNHYGHNEVVVNDSALRNAPGGIYKLDKSRWSFPTPADGNNAACVSIWENFPESMSIALEGKAQELALFVFGSTNAMQSCVVNGRITVQYTDGSAEVCDLIEQENFDDLMVTAFQQQFERFYWDRGNHGMVVRIKLDPAKTLKNCTVQAVANEVIIGILGGALKR